MATDVATPLDRDTAPVRRTRPKRSRNVGDKLISLALLVVLLVVGEVAARLELVSPLILPAPSDVANALVSGFESGVYWSHAYSTVYSAVAGFLIAAAVAVTSAGVLSSIERMERVLMPFIVAFQSMPKIAIAPLFVIWLGFDEGSKIAVTATICFFPMLINSLQGFKVRDRDTYELFASLGASRWQTFRYLRLPGSAPYVFAGFHVGAIFALIGTVVTEFIGSRAGLGYLLIQQQSQFNVPGVFAVVLLLMVIGIGFNRGMLLLERRAAPWAKAISGTSP